MANEQIKIANMERATAAVLDSMLKYGINGTSKESISRRTGISMATIARYYPTKSDMIHAAMCALSDKLVNKNTSYSGNGKNQLHQLFGYILEDFLETPEMYSLRMDIICYSHYSGSDELKKLVEHVGYRKSFIRILKLGMQDGTLKTDLDPEKTVTYYSNMIFGYMSDMTMLGKMDTSEDIEETRNLLTKLLQDVENEITTQHSIS